MFAWILEFSQVAKWSCKMVDLVDHSGSEAWAWA